eukprot:Hpha_TRINITY_DN21414_c0_g1::TRINITY_DN21414_c0_g1_i1::g.148241::m.148241
MATGRGEGDAVMPTSLLGALGLGFGLGNAVGVSAAAHHALLLCVVCCILAKKARERISRTAGAGMQYAVVDVGDLGMWMAFAVGIGTGSCWAHAARLPATVYRAARFVLRVAGRG